MNKVLSLVLLISLPFFLFGQSSSKLLGTWHNENYPPQTYSRIGILAFTPNMNSRVTVEEEFETIFQKKKINAIGTFDVFPLAGQPEIFEGRTEEDIRNGVKEALSKYGLKALLTIAVFDIEREERYKQGPSLTISAPVYGAPAYGYDYYQYFYHATATVTKPGYYETLSTFYIEYNLYDAETAELVWSGQSSTSQPKQLDREAERLAKMVLKRVLKDEALAKP